MKVIDKFRSVALLQIKRAIGICLLLAVAGVSNGQQTTESSSKSDQTLKSSVRINPSTLAMEFSLPLGVFPGRSGNSIPIGFTYSSKLWAARITKSDFSVTSTPPSQTRRDYMLAKFSFARDNMAGWSSSLQPPRILLINNWFFEHPTSGLGLFNSFAMAESDDAMRNSYDSGLRSCSITTSVNGHNACRTTVCVSVEGQPTECETEYADCGDCENPIYPHVSPGGTPPLGPNTVSTRIKRVKIQMPDGSTVEFRKDDSINHCNINMASCLDDMDGSYLSVDGSRMRFERNEVQADLSKRHVLYLPNGSRYVFQTVSSVPGVSNQATEFIDIHGNRTEFNAAQRMWTDTLGRTVQDPSPLPNGSVSNPAVEQTQLVTLPSLPATNRQAQMVWKHLKAPGCESSTTLTCGESVLDDAVQELKFIGTENCGGLWTESNVNLPALFSGAESTSQGPANITTNSKRRACGNYTNETSVRFNPVVLKEVLLPDGQKYSFRYNIYGEITKIIYPTGSIEKFRYDTVAPMGYEMDSHFEVSNRGVKERWVYSDENTLEEHWSYNAQAAGAYIVTIDAPDGSKSERYIYTTGPAFYDFTNPLEGMTFDERVYDAAGEMRSRKLTSWEIMGALPGSGNDYAERDPKPGKVISVIIENNKALASVSSTEYDEHADISYFAHLNPKRTTTSHYKQITDLNTARTGNFETIEALIANAEPATVSETDYLYDANYKARGIPSLAIRTKMLDPVNPSPTATPLAITEIAYDEAAYPLTDPGTVTEWTNPFTLRECVNNIANCHRALPTTSRTWVMETNTWIETHTQYDKFGNAVKAIDPIGNEVTTEFSDDNKYAFPTRVIATSARPDKHDRHKSNFYSGDYVRPCDRAASNGTGRFWTDNSDRV